ncbi:hypothetical protein [Bacillus thuringiensis]|uniref:hypothetical protein n=1 Tax=Bacillus thuringiensis TaxID=1428 RepID=UPI001F513A60|nr:hypothetical protein [Bacillus thuringiensis]
MKSIEIRVQVFALATVSLEINAFLSIALLFPPVSKNQKCIGVVLTIVVSSLNIISVVYTYSVPALITGTLTVLVEAIEPTASNTEKPSFWTMFRDV